METFLRQFDFSSQEVKVYKALLRLGGARVSVLAAKIGVKRTTCQEYLRSMQEKGFVNASKIGNNFFYFSK